MRKLILICVTLVLGISLHAQNSYQELKADTVKGAQTKYIPASANVTFNGIATFDFSAKGFGTNDTCTITLQGKNQGTSWVSTSATTKHGGVTAKDYQLVANPATFLNYRLQIVGKATDTVRVYQPLFISKK